MSVSKLFLLLAIAACVSALPRRPNLRQMKNPRVVNRDQVKNYTPAELPCSYEVTVDEEEILFGDVYVSTSYSLRNKDYYKFELVNGDFVSYHLIKPKDGKHIDHDYHKDDSGEGCSSNEMIEGELEFFKVLYFSRFTETFEYTNITKDYNFNGTKCTAYSILYEHDFGNTTRTTYVDKDNRIIGTLFDDGEEYELEKYTYAFNIPASRFAYDKKLKGCDEEAYTEPKTGICPKDEEPSSSASIATIAKAAMMVAFAAFLF